MSKKALSSSSALHARPPSRCRHGREERKSIPGYEGQFMRPALFEKGAPNWERASRKKGPFAVREFERGREKDLQQSEGLKLYTTMPRVLFARKYLSFPPIAKGQE